MNRREAISDMLGGLALTLAQQQTFTKFSTERRCKTMGLRNVCLS